MSLFFENAALGLMWVGRRCPSSKNGYFLNRFWRRFLRNRSIANQIARSNEIERVNAGSDCFEILGRTARRLLGTQFMKVSVSNDLFLSLFLVKIFFTLKKPPF
jgi:hypothetical protein